MRKELLMLALLALVVGCATTETPIAPVQESPSPVATPTTPSTTNTTSVKTNTSTTIVKGEGCEKNCMSQCIEDSANARGFATDYNTCVSYCGTAIRPQGCKGACASGVPIECSIIFENECEKDCTRACA